VCEGYICKHRRPWWRLGCGDPPPVVVSYMARQAPSFALNPDGLIPVNIAHGLYPREHLGESELKALVKVLNDNRDSFKGFGRTYYGGMEKFEPRELEALMIPESLSNGVKPKQASFLS
jgi:adenine-specific DNA-methyltransferase